MARAFSTLSDVMQHGFDAVIDVRSPAEFAEDHLPGALNLPALSNAERAEIGTIYVQQSRFLARKLGAARVARNVANHLDGALQDMPRNWRPLVYCWRGGQRSGSFATILRQIGWQAETVEGGYQSFRRMVHDALYLAPLQHRLILLDGNTGTAKTDLLHRLATRGVQVLDLEGLAGHRGSLLGDMAGGQPTQKAFESGVACALERLNPARPVIVEAESSKIGSRILPPRLWDAMKEAPRIEVSATLPARAAYLTEAYADVWQDTERLRAKLEVLRRHRGPRVDVWLGHLTQGDMTALAADLMADHYDPSYQTGRARHAAQVLKQFSTQTLSEDGRDRLADLIAEFLVGQSAEG